MIKKSETNFLASQGSRISFGSQMDYNVETFLPFTAGNKLKCFTCNSHQDEFCADPFNWTTLPRIQLCEGCCVKIVQGMGTCKYLTQLKEDPFNHNTEITSLKSKFLNYLSLRHFKSYTFGMAVNFLEQKT